MPINLLSLIVGTLILLCIVAIATSEYLTYQREMKEEEMKKKQEKELRLQKAESAIATHYGSPKGSSQQKAKNPSPSRKTESNPEPLHNLNHPANPLNAIYDTEPKRKPVPKQEPEPDDYQDGSFFSGSSYSTGGSRSYGNQDDYGSSSYDSGSSYSGSSGSSSSSSYDSGSSSYD